MKQKKKELLKQKLEQRKNLREMDFDREQFDKSIDSYSDGQKKENTTCKKYL